MLDDLAKNAYRRRLAEIDEDLDEVRLMRDTGRIVQAEAEREFLIRELSRAVGLSGRGRRAGSASERARVSVTRAIRQAMDGFVIKPRRWPSTSSGPSGRGLPASTSRTHASTFPG